VSKISKQTGPKTKIGKETSSQNAITHGATSKQFLSPQEQKSYAKHLHGLQQSFPVRNYLMDLQIDRLAKLHVQSERIQKIIEAQFLKAQKTSTAAEKLRQELEIEGLQSLRLIETGQLIVDQYAKEQVIELDNYQPFVYWYILTLQNQDLSSDDLIDRAPKLAIFLYQLAQSEHQSINQILDRLIREKPQKAKEFKEKLVSIYQTMSDIEDTAISNEMRDEIAPLNIAVNGDSGWGHLAIMVELALASIQDPSKMLHTPLAASGA
jgi:uncharacterized Ntn-hydrolase superfamily protein